MNSCEMIICQCESPEFGCDPRDIIEEFEDFISQEEARENFSKGYKVALDKVLALLQSTSLLSKSQKKELWREVRALK